MQTRKDFEATCRTLYYLTYFIAHIIILVVAPALRLQLEFQEVQEKQNHSEIKCDTMELECANK